MKNIYRTIIIGAVLLATISCQDEWLDIKRDKKQVVPQSLEDLQAMADNSSVMNEYNTPAIGEIAADNYTLTYENWLSLPIGEQSNTYIWAEEIYDQPTGYSWNVPFELVMYSNLILEALDRIEPEPGELDIYKNVKGSALFYRSWAFFHLSQLFCKQYDPSTASSDPGIPLRLESDVNVISTRATVAQTYDRIISDLKVAIANLPEQPVVKTRPGKAAANALLAKVYLQMRKYNEALGYAETSLQYQNTLLDYNEIDIFSNTPFTMLNEEVVFHSSMSTIIANIIQSMDVDPELYSSYADGDLRKEAYFTNNNGSIIYKGSYNGNIIPFSGIAVDEVYLILAECYARADNQQKAMETLNHLLSYRWKNEEFIPLTATTSEHALELILLERRKSLCFRDIRWSDLRRLNQETIHAVILQRELDNNIYTLLPEDSRYVFPIPDEVIKLTGMQQNQR